MGRLPACSNGTALRINSAGAKKLTSITRRKRSSEASANGPIAPTPALLISRSSPPSSEFAVSSNRWRKAASTTSPATTWASCPVLRICRCKSSNASRRRAVNTSRAPCRANSSAKLRPMPLEAPVRIVRSPEILRLLMFARSSTPHLPSRECWQPRLPAAERRLRREPGRSCRARRSCPGISAESDSG